VKYIEFFIYKFFLMGLTQTEKEFVYKKLNIFHTTSASSPSDTLLRYCVILPTVSLITIVIMYHLVPKPEEKTDLFG
jgi:hypothetical protein